jgi:hypothetical protein
LVTGKSSGSCNKYADEPVDSPGRKPSQLSTSTKREPQKAINWEDNMRLRKLVAKAVLVALAGTVAAAPAWAQSAAQTAVDAAKKFS